MCTTVNVYLFTDYPASISSFLLPNSIQFFFRYPPPLCSWIFYSSGKVDLTCSSRNGLSSLSQVVKFISQATVISLFGTAYDLKQSNKNESQDSCLKCCDKYMHLQAMLTPSLYYIPSLSPPIFNNFPQLRLHIF